MRESKTLFFEAVKTEVYAMLKDAENETWESYRIHALGFTDDNMIEHYACFRDTGLDKIEDLDQEIELVDAYQRDQYFVFTGSYKWRKRV